MENYRLYTVVPHLVTFIGQLTNIYVRYNRSRLKGKNGLDDTRCALSALYNVLFTLCKMMAPFTPFFAEKMYQNLRRCLPDKGKSEPSVHFCPFPEASVAVLDRRVEKSVARMQVVIETGRQIRERNNKSLKTPLKRVTVVHSDGTDTMLSVFLQNPNLTFALLDLSLTYPVRLRTPLRRTFSIRFARRT